MTWNQLRWNLQEIIRHVGVTITRNIPILAGYHVVVSAVRKSMDKVAASGSGLITVSDALLCEECGEALGGKGIAFYDGARWRRVHSACVPEENREF